MGKSLSDAVLDALLNEVADNADKLHICVGEPADYADITSHTKGNVTLTLGDGNGDYTISNGDVSGRKLTVAEQSVTPSADADIDHLVFADSSNSLIKAVTTANFSVKNGVAKTIPEFTLVSNPDPT